MTVTHQQYPASWRRPTGATLCGGWDAGDALTALLGKVTCRACDDAMGINGPVPALPVERAAGTEK